MLVRIVTTAIPKIEKLIFSNTILIRKFSKIVEDQQQKMSEKRLSPLDPNSFARPDLAAVLHTFLDLNINFDKSIIEGKAVLTVEKKSKDVSSLILDTRDLNINKIVSGSDEEAIKYTLDEPVSCFGQKLEINLPSEDKCDIAIHYSTSPKSTALQWLTPQQTAGKKHPYLFSHCEAIHCRAMVPCQDTPSIKSTYSAQISAPSSLLVLMSAVIDGEPVTKGDISIHKFIQKIPIPSYLIALAVGCIESRTIGPRTKVYCEKESVDQAATEFVKTESMLQIAESLCGPYVWGEYNLLVLPPSFPMGGMENPCLTFVTPTLLAGDGSLANVVAHELSHSWTGNLVTNRNFEHFWLNEGFTMFLERKIESKLRGEPSRHLAAFGGLKELQETINNRGAEDPLTKLVPDLTDVDPDEAFSVVPYEKGHTFLFYLEELLGGPKVFDPFLRAYMDEFKYKSITTDDFKDFLYKFFQNKKKELDSVDWNGWLYSPGMPLHIPEYDTSLLDACKNLAKQWVGDTPESCSNFDVKNFTNLTPTQRMIFLNELLKEEPISIAKLKILQKVYDMDSIGNSEIKFRWLRLCIKGRWTDIVPKALDFVTKQGRLKFIKPIYRDLNNWTEIRPQAVENFNKTKDNMMYISIRAVAKALNLEE